MMLKAIITLLLVAGSFTSLAAQLVEVERNGATKRGLFEFKGPVTATAIAEEKSEQSKKPQLFKRGGAELNFEGPAQAIVQILKVFLGEPTGFNLPVYLFLSPAGDVLGGERKPNELTAATLVNPLGGTLNLTLNQDHKLLGKADKYSGIRLAYHLSGKLLSGERLSDPNQGLVAPVGYGDIGLQFQTGAWGEDQSTGVGVAWLQAKIGGSLGPKSDLQDLFGPGVGSSIAHWSISGGIDINNYLNLKLSVSKAIGVDEAPVFENPYVKFAFDVTPKR
jgi:hypothetical protein